MSIKFVRRQTPRVFAKLTLLAFVAFSIPLVSTAESATDNSSWENNLRPAVVEAGQPVPHWSLRDRMAYYHIPGVAVAVLRHGKVWQVKGYGLREAGTHDKIDGDTLFSAGSISKVATAVMILRMVQAGKLDLDRNIDTYLTSWHVPATKDTLHPDVTLRMLMSHTSGFNVGGFPDFMPQEQVPSLLQTLDGLPPAKHHAVRLIYPPGSRYAYSGGGIEVEQQLLEDVTHTDFATAARTWLLDPLHMQRSTFESPLSASRGNIAKAHDEQGKLIALPRGWQSFPEQAASGLWTSANELGAMVAMLIESYQGHNGFLSRALATQMMSPVSPSPQGLGPELLGSGNGRVFFHSGSNDNYRAWMEGYLETGDGFVILTNSPNGARLRLEIRHALSDMIGQGVDPVLHAVALDPADVSYADYQGTYRLDDSVPMDVRGRLADDFDANSFQIAMSHGKASMRVPGDDNVHQLEALSPTRFVDPDSESMPLMQLEFHRDAHGKVQAVSVESGDYRAYYRRQ
ncbi:serine hydrolase domain-containing protein [Dyella sp.]|uniref:serine hydrolase domain-containing protein n=1 Tax=Dyella sp. TaxID=1869338 RepID=UPI002B493D45|nr:serine hydrolase domain-containing protein [Dyella sp.]HKT28692.1 serine hydrolase domain-containing protein [Dyella sp.]